MSNNMIDSILINMKNNLYINPNASYQRKNKRNLLNHNCIGIIIIIIIFIIIILIIYFLVYKCYPNHT